MPKTPRPLLAAFCLGLSGLVLLTLGSIVPASAESLSSARQRRDAARARRAQLAAQLDTLKATDRQLEDAVHRLDAAVATQQAASDAASQAVVAAKAASAAADAKLARTQTRIQTLHSAVVARAVDAYIRPRESPLSGLFTAKSIDEADRRSSILSQVTNTDAEVMDQLKAAREDLTIEQAAARKARAVAVDRQKAADAKLADLKQAQLQQLRLAAALQDRIATFESESSQLASIESSLSSLIQSKEAALRTSGGGVVDGKVSSLGLIWPLRGPVTSEFGPRRGVFHPGIDIAAPSGTPIHAAKTGTVIFAGWEGGDGNYTCIDHGGGFSTCYAHQSSIAVGDGQSVSQGQVIGYEGSTGFSTGPHLHFETRVDGNPQNPRRYLS